MNVSHTDLYRIIIEEYINEEGIELSEDKADDLLAWIKGAQKPEYLDYEKEVPAPPEVPEKEDSETFIMDAPAGGDMSDEEIVASISQMIHGRDPEHVAELFQAVFVQIPGVEIGHPEEEPETLYTPGAEGRPTAGFQLEELKQLIREVLEEGHYHDMGGEDEMYNVLDPEEENSEEAIAGAASQREDGQSFEEWLELLMSTLMHTTNLDIEHAEELPQEENYYDMWLAGEDASTVAAVIARDV